MEEGAAIIRRWFHMENDPAIVAAEEGLTEEEIKKTSTTVQSADSNEVESMLIEPSKT